MISQDLYYTPGILFNDDGFIADKFDDTVWILPEADRIIIYTKPRREKNEIYKMPWLA